MLMIPIVGHGAVGLVLVIVAFGGFSSAIPLHYMTAAEVIPPHRRGAIFGILAATGTLPGLIAPFLTGRIVDSSESVTAGYNTAFILAAGIMIACGVYAAIVIRPQRDARRLGLTVG
jgi:MFS family permease